MMHLMVINYDENFPQKLAKMVCLALSLPFPSDTSNPGGEDTGRDGDNASAKKTEQCMTNKLLLVGCDQSGTSTIFKQVRCSWWNISSFFELNLFLTYIVELLITGKSLLHHC